MAHRLGYSVPSLVWNIDSTLKTKYTPDIGLLESRLFWWFFAYEEFTDGNSPSDYIVFTKDKYLSYVQDRDFNLLLPLPVPEGFSEPPPTPAWADPNRSSNRQAPSSRVRGTLHLVSPETLISLDKDLLNTVRFLRQRVTLLYPHRRMPLVEGKPRPDLVVHTLKAWMYVANPTYWSNMIEDNPTLFKPAKLQRPQSLWIGDFAYKEGWL